MKKTLLTLTFAIASVSLFAQQKQISDTTKIKIEMTVGELKNLLSILDANIDSKKLTKDISDFLKGNAQILQPSDKPKK